MFVSLLPFLKHNEHHSLVHSTFIQKIEFRICYFGYDVSHCVSVQTLLIRTDYVNKLNVLRKEFVSNNYRSVYELFGHFQPLARGPNKFSDDSHRFMIDADINSRHPFMVKLRFIENEQLGSSFDYFKQMINVSCLFFFPVMNL